MATFVTTGGSLGPGGAGGATMKDSAPDGYDYYILSDGTGDYTEVDTALIAILGMGAGHYKVYIGPGSWDVNWTTAWPESVTMTLIGAGKFATKLNMSGNMDLGTAAGTGKGFAEISSMTFIRGDSWNASINMSTGSGTETPMTLADGNPSPVSIHDCRFEQNTTGKSEYSFVFAGRGTKLYNCEFVGVYAGDADAGNGVAYSVAGTVRNCYFDFQEGALLEANSSHDVSGCTFITGGTDPTDRCLRIANYVGMVSECTFRHSGTAYPLRVERGGALLAVVQGNVFETHTQANAVDFPAGLGTCEFSRNVYTDAIDTA